VFVGSKFRYFVTDNTVRASRLSISSLGAKINIAHVEIDMEECFIAQQFSPASQPLLLNHRKWLRSFFQTFPQWVDRDSFASTYASLGAVILAAVAADCRDVDFLQGLLRLPRQFVALVINVMDATSLWASERILDLECALRDQADDFAEIEELLHAIKEELWDKYWSEDLGTLLELYRSGCLIGGAVEHWVDDEPVNDYQVVM
jgi:hypothetical protein